MKVYTLHFGSIDSTDESLCGIYAKDTDAKEAAISTIHQILDESGLTEEGYTYDDTIQENGDWVVSILASTGDETEWWRVTEVEVK